MKSCALDAQSSCCLCYIATNFRKFLKVQIEFLTFRQMTHGHHVFRMTQEKGDQRIP